MKVIITILSFVFILSYGLLIQFYVIPVLKKITKKINQSLFHKESNYSELELIEQSIKMASDKKVHMPMENSTDLLTNLRSLLHKHNKQNNLYFFPKAYLIAGLTDYGIIRGDKNLMTRISKIYEFYFLDNGSAKFNFDKVDQIPFGIAAINLYKFFKLQKYRDIADFIYKKVVEWVDTSTQIIPYRTDSKLYFVDTLGMVCPFLVRYSISFNNSQAQDIAYNQILFFIEKGIDSSSSLPYHVVHKEYKIKLGPSNWGRGIGWYLLALAEFNKYFDDQQVSAELQKSFKTLRKFELEDGLWSQFPGTSLTFDASVSTMILYSMILNKNYKEDILHKIHSLKRHVQDGILRNSSGDTINVNKYSTIFGNSELSQGILLSILSNL